LLLLLLLLQGIDIVSTLIQINHDLRFFPYRTPEPPGEPGQHHSVILLQL
jgi:hypothetical protein